MGNRQAKYYSMIGSHEGAIKIGRAWIHVTDLNRIDKSGWIRWQGPPSEALTKAMREKSITAVEVIQLEENIKEQEMDQAWERRCGVR